MNLQKKYEQYVAGEFSAYNFLREARMTYPHLVTNLNGIEDAVTILKNNSLVFEAKEEYQVEQAISLDALDSGTHYELGEMGCDIHTCTEDQFMDARSKARKNLEKDAAHYANLKAGITKKDDSDQMRPATSQNMVDDANKIQKLQEAILTVALKRMLTEGSEQVEYEVQGKTQDPDGGPEAPFGPIKVKVDASLTGTELRMAIKRAAQDAIGERIYDFKHKKA